ncbi:hypothetical protein QTP70_001315 [Hemibagrus guttatus]|uniref:Retrotransposon gag domain-containing protein n=1 Tax=Hemibagrus guttatus TaxID=175788 RepID=A0AAE0V9T0_9TELE|nr:hypothetical protein QTP70_001315 [Hemibagrus guttatus]
MEIGFEPHLHRPPLPAQSLQPSGPQIAEDCTQRVLLSCLWVRHKTKELIVDFSTKQERNYQPLIINGTLVEAQQHLYHIRRLKDFKLPSKVLKTFYTCTIESVLTGSITAWFGNSTKQDRQALQRVDTSPASSPADYHAALLHQGKLIWEYQNQVAALQAENLQVQQQSQAPATPPNPPPHPAPHRKSQRMALPEKFDVHEVYEYPGGGKDISVQLLELRQGTDTAADYAIKFRTLAAQSGWNDIALLAVFWEGLRPSLQAELACHSTNTTLAGYVNTAISLDNLRYQHPAPSQSRQPAPQFTESSRPREDTPEPMQLGRARVSVEEHRSLIDSGAAINLIDSNLVGKLQLPTVPCTPPLRVMAVNNEPIGEGYLYCKTRSVSLTIGLFHTEHISLFVINSPAHHPGTALVTAP